MISHVALKESVVTWKQSQLSHTTSQVLFDDGMQVSPFPLLDCSLNLWRMTTERFLFKIGDPVNNPINSSHGASSPIQISTHATVPETSRVLLPTC